jgi:hypothetical protein
MIHVPMTVIIRFSLFHLTVSLCCDSITLDAWCSQYRHYFKLQEDDYTLLPKMSRREKLGSTGRWIAISMTVKCHQMLDNDASEATVFATPATVVPSLIRQYI